MLVATRIKIIQPIIKGIAIIFLLTTTLPSSSQVAGNDWVVVTIESVKCIKPSTGQDAYTSFLFKGIEIAIHAAFAAASGGSSLTATAATQIGKEALKKTIKAGLKIAITNQAKNFYAANKEEIMGLANIGNRGNGGENSNFAKVAGVAKEVYELTSLQGIFNKVYGESPDDLYIKVNGNKVWPGGKSASIKSQQRFNVGFSFNTQKKTGFSIQLVEYDQPSPFSNDTHDNLGVLTFKIPPNFIGSTQIVDQVFHHEEEGSLYMMTLHVESLLKHQFINNLHGSSWDFNYQGISSILNFDPATLDFADNIQPGWRGIMWGIQGPDHLRCYIPNTGSWMNIRFNSENSFTGTFEADQSTFSGTRRTSMHRYINNIVGSTWTSTVNGSSNMFTFGDGFATASDYTVITWNVIGSDRINFCINNQPYMNIRFLSENTLTGEYILKNQDGSSPAFSAIRNGSQVQTLQPNQQQQQQYINNIVGTSWNFSDPASGNVSFSFGQGTINNVSPSGTFWDDVTWKVIGNDIIELKTKAGAAMTLVFSNKTNFSGYSWYNKAVVATGTINFQHRFINNIMGTSWKYTEPGIGTFSFSFGNGVISNFSTPGTYWDAVTWKVLGTDIIELRAPTGLTMNLTFSDQNNFRGTFWNNGTNVVTGTKR